MLPLPKTPENWTPPTIVVMGLGAGVFTLPDEYFSWIESSDVVVSGKNILSSLNIPHGIEIIPIKSPLNDVLQTIKMLAPHKKVLVITSGDPLFFGIGRKIIQEFGNKQVIVLPNITFVQYLASKIALPWDDFISFSLHGREINRSFFYWLRNGRKIAFFTDPHNNPANIANMLISKGFENVDIVVGERLGTSDEFITKTTPMEVASRNWKEPNIVFALPPSPTGNVGYLDEELFEHDAGMITKREVRSVAISSLRLRDGATLWDLGAGSGSVSIEASYTRPLFGVHAVERSKKRYERLCSNISRFKCGEVIPYHGNILDIIKKLPQPDRIFIGGGGKSLPRILDKIKNLFPKFIPSVITAVAWDTIETVKNFAYSNSLPLSVIQVSVNRSAPIMNSFRLEALNPVFILTLGF